MTTIEEKRKELEDKDKKEWQKIHSHNDVIALKYNNTIDHTYRMLIEAELKGFNLGVELAQREFLEYLQWIINDKSNLKSKKYYPTIVQKIKELKTAVKNGN